MTLPTCRPATVVHHAAGRLHPSNFIVPLAAPCRRTACSIMGPITAFVRRPRTVGAPHSVGLCTTCLFSVPLQLILISRPPSRRSLALMWAAIFFTSLQRVASQRLTVVLRKALFALPRPTDMNGRWLCPYKVARGAALEACQCQGGHAILPVKGCALAAGLIQQTISTRNTTLINTPRQLHKKTYSIVPVASIVRQT